MNGLGWFLGNLDGGTVALFKHVDYMVQLVGAGHVGLGLDYVQHADLFSKFIQSRPDQWPPNNGEGPPDTGFSQPEQVEKLCERTVGVGHSEHDIRGILGLNFRAVCEKVWK